MSQTLVVRRADTETALRSALDSLEPPRDYAPKEANGPGTLSEDFGIKRKS